MITSCSMYPIVVYENVLVECDETDQLMERRADCNVVGVQDRFDRYFRRGHSASLDVSTDVRRAFQKEECCRSQA